MNYGQAARVDSLQKLGDSINVFQQIQDSPE